MYPAEEGRGDSVVDVYRRRQGRQGPLETRTHVLIVIRGAPHFVVVVGPRRRRLVIIVAVGAGRRR